MAEEKQIGHRVVGTIKEVKGSCSAGHKVGDQFELSGYTSGGLCGFFYHFKPFWKRIRRRSRISDLASKGRRSFILFVLFRAPSLLLLAGVALIRLLSAFRCSFGAFRFS
jgi:hypothetical protein